MGNAMKLKGTIAGLPLPLLAMASSAQAYGGD